MSLQNSSRYTGIAIGLHWLIATLIIGMLAVGKYMTGLDENDPTRFLLTQWHKSFGIAILLLSVLRLIWRVTHHPPALPEHTPAWEKRAAGLTHLALYVLIIAIPLTGWIMVSASPLNLETVLFQSIPWPHLPLLTDLSNKAAVADLFQELHEIAASVLIVLLLLHIGAALKHQLVQKDEIMARMSLRNPQGKLVNGLGFFGTAIIALAMGIFAYASISNPSTPLAATGSQVTFTAVMMGSDLNGVFGESAVELQLDPAQPSSGSLSATVQTASLNTGDTQVDSTVPGPDWFLSEKFPEATFTSTSMTGGDNGQINVNGELAIRGNSGAVSFPMDITEQNGKQTASGAFTINRLDFDIGKVAQPTDETVGFNVLIGFTIELE